MVDNKVKAIILICALVACSVNNKKIEERRNSKSSNGQNRINNSQNATSSNFEEID